MIIPWNGYSSNADIWKLSIGFGYRWLKGLGQMGAMRHGMACWGVPCLTFACGVDVSTVCLLAVLLSVCFMKTLTTISPLLFAYPVCQCAHILVRLPFPVGSGHRPVLPSALLLPASAPLLFWPPLPSPPVNGWMVRHRCGIRWWRTTVSEIQDGCHLCICGVWMMVLVCLDWICVSVYLCIIDMWLGFGLNFLVFSNRSFF